MIPDAPRIPDPVSREPMKIPETPRIPDAPRITTLEDMELFNKAVAEDRQREHEMKVARKTQGPVETPKVETFRQDPPWEQPPPRAKDQEEIDPPTHPYQVSLRKDGANWLATVDIDSYLYSKADYKVEVTIDNLLTTGDLTEFSVASGYYLYLQGAYVAGVLDAVTIEVGATPGNEIETEDTADVPPETQQTFWRYLICKFATSGSVVIVEPQIARNDIRLFDRYFEGVLVEYPLAL